MSKTGDAATFDADAGNAIKTTKGNVVVNSGDIINDGYYMLRLRGVLADPPASPKEGDLYKDTDSAVPNNTNATGTYIYIG